MERVNADVSILPGYHLQYQYKDSGCSASDALKNLSTMISGSDSTVDAVVGPACSVRMRIKESMHVCTSTCASACTHACTCGKHAQKDGRMCICMRALDLMHSQSLMPGGVHTDGLSDCWAGVNYARMHARTYA